jgi:PTH1 family peptidyl-tRNA hydrolase
MTPRIIIGLGNPDPEYDNTYHNVGHQFIAMLMAHNPHAPQKLIKTDAYMNESGACVAEALKKYKAKPAELLVVHDDSDIALGAHKISFGRNAGGHRGVQNIIDHVRTNAFWRLRIGIRPRAERKRRKASELVLKSISAANAAVLKAVFAKAAAELGL